MGQVAVQGGPEQEGAAGLDDRAAIHQHAANIGVDDDRVGGAVGVLRPGQRAALQPILGEGRGGLVGGLGLGDALQAHPDPGLVHHHEHQAQALVLGPHQPAGALVMLDDAGGVAVDAHLLLEAGAEDAVARARLAVRVGNELGHDEQADPPHPSRRALDAGQHQVDDVLGHVVLAPRDPDFLARDLVASIGLRDRLGAQQAKIGAALGLGQVHRPAPFPGDQVGQVEALLRVGSAIEDRRIAAVGQARVHGEGHVGRGAHLRERQVHHMGQALAAIGRLRADRRPAALDELGVGLLEPRRRGDRIVRAPGAAFLVADGVQGREHLGGETAALPDDLLHHIHRSVGEGRQVCILLDLQHVAQQEDVVAHGGLVGHVRSGEKGEGLPTGRKPLKDTSRGTPAARSAEAYLACSRSPRRSRRTWS